MANIPAIRDLPSERLSSIQVASY
jgi:PilZ domain